MTDSVRESVIDSEKIGAKRLLPEGAGETWRNWRQAFHWSPVPSQYLTGVMRHGRHLAQGGVLSTR